MTEIKVFGRPKSEIIKILRESLQKLDINISELYLAFAKNKREIKKYWKKFSKTFLAISSGERGEKFIESLIEMESRVMVAACVSKLARKENLPPVIVVNLGSEVPEIVWEDSIFHEALHVKDEIIGWRKIEERVYLKAQEMFCLTFFGDVYLASAISDCISDFFGYEIASQYGFEDYVLRHKRRYILNTLEKFGKISEGEKIRWFARKSSGVVDNANRCAFTVNFPPSYKERERDQKILEREFSPILHYFPEYIDFQSLASLPSQIKVPPEETNLLKIYGKIFEIYSDFLIRSSKGA